MSFFSLWLTDPGHLRWKIQGENAARTELGEQRLRCLSIERKVLFCFLGLIFPVFRFTLLCESLLLSGVGVFSFILLHGFKWDAALLNNHTCLDLFSVLRSYLGFCRFAINLVCKMCFHETAGLRIFLICFWQSDVKSLFCYKYFDLFSFLLYRLRDLLFNVESDIW